MGCGINNFKYLTVRPELKSKGSLKITEMHESIETGGIFFALPTHKGASEVKISIMLFFMAMALSWSVDTTLLGAGTDQGEIFYIQYCSSCHGKDGRGEGSVSPYLKLKIPDLSLLKQNHKGIYPMDNVMAAIDGRRSVRAHGDREMPVWGEVFRKEAEHEKYSELTSLLKARVIAEYVARLQR